MLVLRAATSAQREYSRTCSGLVLWRDQAGWEVPPWLGGRCRLARSSALQNLTRLLVLAVVRNARRAYRAAEGTLPGHVGAAREYD